MNRSSSELLAADTGMGAVTLRVGNLDAMIAYYRDAVSLTLLSHDGPVAVLGRGTTPIAILQHAPELAAAELPACGRVAPPRRSNSSATGHLGARFARPSRRSGRSPAQSPGRVAG